MKEFLYKQNNNPKDWFNGINALYNKTDAKFDDSILSETTRDWISKKSKILSLELDFMTSESEKQEAKLELDAIEHINENYSGLTYTNKRNLLEWRSIVKAINGSYQDYLECIKGKTLKYLIISEAPMLNYESSKFSCNYVFGNNKKVGAYRKVPYEAFDGEKTDPDGKDLIELFSCKEVGFFDLIPIPLPKIDTELRRLWSQDPAYYVEGLPRTVFFLKLAFEEFLKQSECKTTNNTKVILMMPPNTAMGIISFYLNKGKTHVQALDELSVNFLIENSNSEILKNNDLNGFPVRLHRQIVMNGSGGPDLKLFKHAL